jgi:hypothetical protein
MKSLVEVFWGDDDQGYVEVVPDLPGCPASGGTLEALVHDKMLMKEHRDTQSRGFAWVLDSFGNFGPWRRPRPQQSAEIDTQTFNHIRL